MRIDNSNPSERSFYIVVSASMLLSATLIHFVVDHPGIPFNGFYPVGFFLFPMFFFADLFFYKDVDNPDWLSFSGKSVITLLMVIMIIIISFYYNEHALRMKALKYGNRISGIATTEISRGYKSTSYYVTVKFDSGIMGKYRQTFQIEAEDYYKITNGQKLSVVYSQEGPSRIFLADFDTTGFVTFAGAWFFLFCLTSCWLWYSFKWWLNKKNNT